MTIFLASNASFIAGDLLAFGETGEHVMMLDVSAGFKFRHLCSPQGDHFCR